MATKKTVKSYRDDDMQLAVSAVRENRMSQRKAADAYHVNRETLQRHIKASEKNEIVAGPGRPTEIS